MRPDQQETLLHNCKFASPPVVTPHSAALLPIRAYCADPRRPISILEAAIQVLQGKSQDDSITPKGREESLRCIETIKLFMNAENGLGIRSLRLEECDRMPMMQIEGVEISVQPDLFVQSGSTKQRERCGLIFFRPQKAPDPAASRLEETKRAKGDHRREMARYILALGQTMAEATFSEGRIFDRDSSFVADIRIGERIAFSSQDHASRMRAVQAACRQISKLWSMIEPRRAIMMK